MPSAASKAKRQPAHKGMLRWGPMSDSAPPPPCDTCHNMALCRDAGLACYEFAEYAGSCGPAVVKFRRTPHVPRREILVAMSEA